MKATIKPHLYVRRMKLDGKYPVKLRVRYDREKRFYALGIDMTEKEFGEYHLSKKLKPLFDDISYFQKKADGIINELKENFNWDDFERQFLSKTMLSESNKDEVLPAILQYVDILKTEERIKSAGTYKNTYNHLANYVGGKKLLFVNLNTEFLKGFDKYLRGKELSNSSIGIFMRNLRAIFNQAITEKKVSAEMYPFGRNKYSPPSTKNTKKSLSVEDIGKIFNYSPDSEIEQWSKDMWLFAYFASGINIKDLALLKYKNIVSDEIQFVRAKTRNSTQENEKTINVVLTEEMKTIIKKWGKKKINREEYIFEIVSTKDDSAINIYRNVHQAIKTINKYMSRIAEKLNLERRPTTNFARHSYATVLKRAGVPIEMISEQLGHSNIKTTEIYLGSFEKEQRREVTKHLTAFKLKNVLKDNEL